MSKISRVFSVSTDSTGHDMMPTLLLTDLALKLARLLERTYIPIILVRIPFEETQLNNTWEEGDATAKKMKAMRMLVITYARNIVFGKRPT